MDISKIYGNYNLTIDIYLQWKFVSQRCNK